MTEENKPHERCYPSSHDFLWWLVLLPLLSLLLVLGFYVVLSQPVYYPFLFGAGGFSIAYALHFFSVSGALCGIYVRYEDKDKNKEAEKCKRLRNLEYRIVTSAMCALAGGLMIILAGGLCAIQLRFAPCVYSVGAGLLFGSVLKYVLFERNWPRIARKILFPA